MAKKNQVAKVKNLDCLNCGYPFFGNEIYCPECGQKNQNDALSFKNFMSEVFQGFTSWDAKFWKTIVPLLTKPGKVSKEYIEGKRAKYTNPFRFYITTSILFFLLLGLGNLINDYRSFNSNKTYKRDLGIIKVDVGENDDKSIKSDFKEGWNSYNKEKTDNQNYQQGIIDAIEDNEKDSLTNAKIFGKDITDYVAFQRKYPNLNANQALDSLKEPKTFFNKFLYKKSETINGFSKNPTKSVNLLISEAVSHISTAIFILLPVFALFLKLLYFRKKYRYVEHLIFVFHTQTVFFLLLIISSLIGFFIPSLSAEISTNILILLFSVYLFIAMKAFYNQGYFKTIIKYLITVSAYSFIALIGTGIVTAIAFVMM